MVVVYFNGREIPHSMDRETPSQTVYDSFTFHPHNRHLLPDPPWLNSFDAIPLLSIRTAHVKIDIDAYDNINGVMKGLYSQRSLLFH